MDQKAFWKQASGYPDWCDGFTRHHHGGEPGEVYMRSLCIISHNYMWVYDDFKVKNLI